MEKIVREYVVKGTDVRFDSPEKGKVSKPVISIYLYDIQENLDMRTSFGGFPKANNKSIYPAADPYYNAEGTVNVTCRYLFTFWESEANGANGQAFRNPAIVTMNRVLNAILNHRNETKLEVLYYRIIPPMDLQSLGTFWQAMDSPPRLCLGYELTVPIKLNLGTPPNAVADIELSSDFNFKKTKKKRVAR